MEKQFNPQEAIERRLLIQETIKGSVEGMSVDEFSKAFPVEEYEIYTPASLKKYVDTILKSGDEDTFEKAKKNLSKLQKKIVTDKTGKKMTVWVKPAGTEVEKEFNPNGVLLNISKYKGKDLDEVLHKIAVKGHYEKLSHINKIRFEKEWKANFGREFSSMGVTADWRKEEKKAEPKKDVKPKPSGKISRLVSDEVTINVDGKSVKGRVIEASGLHENWVLVETPAGVKKVDPRDGKILPYTPKKVEPTGGPYMDEEGKGKLKLSDLKEGDDVKIETVFGDKRSGKITGFEKEDGVQYVNVQSGKTPWRVRLSEVISKAKAKPETMAEEPKTLEPSREEKRKGGDYSGETEEALLKLKAVQQGNAHYFDNAYKKRMKDSGEHHARTKAMAKSRDNALATVKAIEDELKSRKTKKEEPKKTETPKEDDGPLAKVRKRFAKKSAEDMESYIDDARQDMDDYEERYKRENDGDVPKYDPEYMDLEEYYTQLVSIQEEKLDEEKEKGGKGSKSKTNPEYDEVRNWVGSSYSDRHIKSIADEMFDSGIEETDLQVKKGRTPEDFQYNVSKQTSFIFSELNESHVDSALTTKDVKKIISGMIRVASTTPFTFFAEHKKSVIGKAEIIDILKGKDLSKLMKKQVTDKKGKKTTVWVKQGEEPKGDKPTAKVDEKKGGGKSTTEASSEHPAKAKLEGWLKEYGKTSADIAGADLSDTAHIVIHMKDGTDMKLAREKMSPETRQQIVDHLQADHKATAEPKDDKKATGDKKPVTKSDGGKKPPKEPAKTDKAAEDSGKKPEKKPSKDKPAKATSQQRAEVYDLVDDPPEDFFDKIVDHFGEPEDDGESEHALIKRILSHGGAKVQAFLNDLKGEGKNGGEDAVSDDDEAKVTDLVSDPPEDFFDKVVEHFGEPEDDGESESALIDRILSHGGKKVTEFLDSLGDGAGSSEESTPANHTVSEYTDKIMGAVKKWMEAAKENGGDTDVPEGEEVDKYLDQLMDVDTDMGSVGEVIGEHLSYIDPEDKLDKTKKYITKLLTKKAKQIGFKGDTTAKAEMISKLKA